MASRNYHFKFNTERDKTYIERLDAQDNMQNYIRRLILSDIAADGLRDVLVYSDTDSIREPNPVIKRKLNAIYGKALDLHDHCKHCEEEEEPDAPECKSCPCGDQDPDDDAIEFQRRADLMARYCHGVGDNSDPEYCYSCVWGYHPDNFSDVIKCKFEGLSADEMEKVIKDWRDRIDRMFKDQFKEDVINNMLEENQ